MDVYAFNYKRSQTSANADKKVDPSGAVNLEFCFTLFGFQISNLKHMQVGAEIPKMYLK